MTNNIVALGDLGTFRNGFNFSKEQMGSGVKLINVKNIFGDDPRIDFNNLDLVDLGDKELTTSHTVMKNDLFFVRSSVKRDGIGLVRLATMDRNDAVHCGFIIRFRLSRVDVNPLYLTYHLRSPDLRKEIISVSGGSAIINISQDSLSTIKINLPPFVNQSIIATILSAYDDLIENNLRRIKILEEMAQNLYREWFVNFRFPGHEKTRFVDSPLGQIPEGWEIKELIDFGDITTGKTPSKSKPEYYGEDMPFIKLPDMHNSIFCINTKDALSKLGANTQKTKTIPPNSLCVSCIGTVGKVIITTYFSQTNQQINSIVLKRKEDLEFLYFALHGLKQQIESYSATGATMNNLSRGKFISLKVLYSTEEVINSYHLLVAPLFKLILNLELKIKELRQTRDLLLPKLISGEVDVSDLDINVP